MPSRADSDQKLQTGKNFELFAQKVLVIVGKGGTGRTTVARILAEVATKAGKRTAVIAGASGTFYVNREDSLLTFASLEPGDVLIDYLDEHGLGQLGKRLSSSGLASIISTAIPGIADLLVLAKIKQMERSETADLIIFDAPASGHFLKLISTPKGLAEIAAAGPLQKQSKEVLEMLTDPARLGVAFVTAAEDTPVKESIETMEKLRQEAGISPKALFVNALLPQMREIGGVAGSEIPKNSSAISRAAQYTSQRASAQRKREAVAERAFGLAPIEIPLVPKVELDDDDIKNLAEIVEPQIQVAR